MLAGGIMRGSFDIPFIPVSKKNKNNRIILFLSIVALGSLAVQSIDWLTLLTSVLCIAM